ncbi:MAG: TOBE domain-containing protein, partial [Thermomicrobiales bacterium]
VMQVGTPRELYERPVSRFVADFIGRINLFEAEAAGADHAGVTCRTSDLGTVTVPGTGPASGPVTLAVRPERITLGPARPAAGTIATEGVVEDVAYFGDVSRLIVTMPSGQRVQVSLPNTDPGHAAAVAPGDRRWISWRQEDMLLLPNQSAGQRS